ncbi:eukaryotic translation initiation factor 1A [Neoconidiobolus thromboides FSU 785]|nr:eukaryotic translation initiation factor 1A [Neoconidiobolus thromboides FSU 785]
MPKNKGKGGKNRRRGKNENENTKRELILADEGQEYAQVLTMLGNGRLTAQSFDGTKRLALIRGKMRKKVWISAGDIILLSLRDFQDDKADVIMKYTPDEARALKSQGAIPDTGKSQINENAGGDEDEDVGFDFDSEAEDGEAEEVDIDDI